MVFRVYVEKKEPFRKEAADLRYDIRHMLSIKSLEDVRIINRYDVENLSEELFDYAVKTVFSEPQLDTVSYDMDSDGATVFAVEYLPGQFDQRADSASQCIQIISQGQRPLVRYAKIYVLFGHLSAEELKEIKNYVINPVESREASLEKPETLKEIFETPKTVEVVKGFNSLSKEELSAFVSEYSLAMDEDDIAFCQEYFRSEDRDPTITEIRMIDTYWSDHCRHTTFLTVIDDVEFEDDLLKNAYADYLSEREKLGRKKPICLMDIATIAVPVLKKEGKLDKLDESDEINACTVKMTVSIDGKEEPWLLLFKNETHNHPTEIEPFGGAATCIGGAIRDPLSGRAYVYGAMRITGASDPTVHVRETIPGKLPQRKIVTTAAAGYSSYGNQIGLATGIVDELYHPGYVAKRMEIGAVVAAAPRENVRREVPSPGDKIILLGGQTGRDGIGGATGSSKAHNTNSVDLCGAEVQKGNAPEERKLQRLFRSKECCRLIKRCNDFGAGGVSVAIGELADGLDIDLDLVPKKYEGLDGTELAISESQERMAVVVEEKDCERFIELAEAENLQATVVAEVKADPRLTMYWNGKVIVDVSRDFLNSNGAEKHINVRAEKPKPFKKEVSGGFRDNLLSLAENLNTCSHRGLSERFDSTIGAGTVLMPFGGKKQLTPVQAMAQVISSDKGHCGECSLMSWGFNPYISERSPYHGAYYAVVESVSKLIATGARFEDIYLTFQEYFESPRRDPKRWGKPLSALLGALRAQLDLGIASIGGKDSMSGSFESIDVPPTLVSFAVTTEKIGSVVSNEYKKAGNKVFLLKPEIDQNGLPNAESLKALFERVNSLMRSGEAVSCYTPGFGGIGEAVAKASLGNGLGFRFNGDLSADDIFAYNYGAFLLESENEISDSVFIGSVTDDGKFSLSDESVSVTEFSALYEGRLEGVYTCNSENKGKETDAFCYKATSYPSPVIKTAKPRVLIPVFPGTNCEYDSSKAVSDAGGEAKISVIKNLSPEDIRRSIDVIADELKRSQMLFIPGGFSGGDEPEGSAKFIAAFFRNEKIREAVEDLLDVRGGLICGICNGFQALVKLGLVPYGKITDTDENSPTLSYNSIGRHQSKIVRTRVASNKSPWLSLVEPGEIFNVPISHGEGRFIASEELVRKMAENGQIATQYVDLDGNVSNDIRFNPNDSVFAIEGITSPDGRVFGKMGHSERTGYGLYKNVPGNYDIRMFEAAVKYFK